MTPPAPPAGVIFVIFVGALALILVPMFIATQRRKRATAGGALSFRQRQPTRRDDAPPPPPTPLAAPIARSSDASVPPEMPMTPTVLSWQQLLVELAKRPHIGIAAESQAGKSTLAMALMNLRAHAGHQLVILNPHASPTAYGGLSQIQSYNDIQNAMHALLGELESRKQQASAGVQQFQPVTIIVEETPDLLSRIASEDGTRTLPKVPIARRFIAEMLMQAAKYKMHVILLTQSTQAKPLGLEGQLDVLDNLLFVALGERAIEENAAAATMPRPAVLLARRQAFLADISPALALAGQPLLDDVVWRFSVPVAQVDDEPRSEPAEPPTENQSAEPMEQFIREILAMSQMVRNGDSGNKIIDSLGGNRGARLAQIRAVKAALAEDKQ